MTGRVGEADEGAIRPTCGYAPGAPPVGEIPNGFGDDNRISEELTQSLIGQAPVDFEEFGANPVAGFSRHGEARLNLKDQDGQ